MQANKKKILKFFYNKNIRLHFQKLFIYHMVIPLII